MKVRIDDEFLVDVVDAKCPTRDCFSIGYDKGLFVQGRGYTRYHTDAEGRRVEHPVCQTRHLHGCPSVSRCPACHTVGLRDPGEVCGSLRGTDGRPCDGVLVPYSTEAP